MDDLLREFLTETNESLGVVDVELVRFEQEPNNASILANIFRLVHTIKGTCGFLGLPRLEALTHAAETLMGKFREGMPVTGEAVTLILFTIDRIKEILDELEQSQQEPAGTDDDLIGQLHGLLHQVSSEPPAAPPGTVGSLVNQRLERPLLPGEVSLDELERAFRETPGPVPDAPEQAAACAKPAPAEKKAKDDEERSESKIASQSIRVNVDTLEQLMTMVSELVLTRNQLLEMVRRHEDSEFKVPLQRLSTVTAELQEGVMKTRMQPVGNAWQKLPRIVRDLATELGKQIDLEMNGADTELDRQVLDLIKDPLTHMVRNSADHGLETPEQRRAAGKPEKGTIRLSAYHEGGYIIIEVADDGRGLDTEKIKAKAIASWPRFRGRRGEDDGNADPAFHLYAGFFHHHHGHQRVRPRRRHGRGARQYRSDRRHHRCAVHAGPGHERDHQDPAHACDHLSADRGIRRPSLRHPAAFGD